MVFAPVIKYREFFSHLGFDHQWLDAAVGVVGCLNTIEAISVVDQIWLLLSLKGAAPEQNRAQET